MIQITPQMRIWVAVDPVDFRKGIDGLAALCRHQLQADPMDGAVFVFGARNRRAIKCLVYDSQGFWLCQKRLSSGRFKAWPGGDGCSRRQALSAHQLLTLLWNGDPSRTDTAPVWRPVNGSGASA
jgi:transposase